MPERIRKELAEVPELRYRAFLFYCHLIVFRHRLRAWWCIPRPIAIPLIATGISFGLLLVMPRCRMNIIRAPADGIIAAVAFDLLLRKLVGI